MSSGDEEYSRSTGEDAKLKKRRIQRACDTCRRKKIRCDGATTPGNKCSNCAAYSYDCTYVEAAKKRGPPKGYVESLEGRLQKMESLLQRLCPDADFTQELGVHMDRETWYSERQALPQLPPPPSPAHPHVPDAPDDPQPPDDVHRLDDDRRFHGRSSGLVLVQAAIDMKREYTGADPTASHPSGAHPSLWGPPDLRPRPADGPADDPVAFDFPPPDLVDALVPLFFVHNNTYLPVLHRPTFDRQYRDRLHERDPAFAHILLLVCAIAARNSHDPRVLRPDVPDRHSAGWKYFDQVRIQRKSLIAPASLFDLQQYALAGIFLQGSAAPYAGWVTVGIGLRVAQDVGAHRKRIDDPTPSVQSELWKRAFWVLVNLDRLGSAALGRPCAIHDEDFDLDPPLEVDDEYWESPSPEDAFVQPTGRPSTVAYFNALIRLDQILSFALRTIYSINKSKILLGFAGEKDWAQNTVVELDTALNQWLETVPEHLRWDLRWDPSNEFSVFFQQSAILYATYYHIQILVHRPFIPRPGKPAPLSFPSLAICTNAARSCSQVLQAHRSKCDPGAAPHLMFYAFTSGLVLLLNIWGTHRPGHAAQRPPDADMPMHDVHMCMQFLKAAENRWPLAGRLWDILCELASAGDFPLPHPSPVAGSKRERDADSPRSATASDYAMAQDAASASASPGAGHAQHVVDGADGIRMGGLEPLYGEYAAGDAARRPAPAPLTHVPLGSDFSFFV
ncbi:fungal-specific transcription factor domain-containing protein [Gautieria morchelliformis]|nr:fungal-specific transcription factor domain-containing protein [Gautieria morchelliformis]